MCVLFAACGENSNSEKMEEYEDLIKEQKRTIKEYETLLEEQENTIKEYEEIINTHGNVLDEIKNGNFDTVISRMEQLKKEAKAAENAAKGVLEIAITIDNWDQYFEYTPTGYVYIKNSFNEITHMNFTGGIKLKDEYTLAQDNSTKVSFEMVTSPETRNCVIDFTTGDVEYGEVISVDEKSATYTTSYTNNVFRRDSGVAGYGQIHQVQKTDANVVEKEISFCRITEMLRVEGTLYIYEN